MDASKTKYDIKPNEIRANIYDSVQIIVDIHGVTWFDIESVLQNLNEVLPAENYSRIYDSLTLEEINGYGDRRDSSLSMPVRKRYLDTENVIRYCAKNNSEIITISRLFVSVFLSYEIAHNLGENIKLMNKIIQLLNRLDYFEVEKIFLVKKDSIYCSSLYRMYQCFEKKMFADSGYQIFPKNKSDTGVTRVYNNFAYDNTEVIINKEIIVGMLVDTDEMIYQGKLETTLAKEPLDDEINIEDVLNSLNDISFKIFIGHITDGFANDLVAGKTDKVKKGVNFYE